MKICIDTTPVTPQPSGVGLYVLNLVQELFQLQAEEKIQLLLAYQPKLLNWLKGNWDFPSRLESYSHKSIVPIPVRLSNLLFRYSHNWSGKWLTNYLGEPSIMHGTNYSVYPLSSGYRVMTIYDVSFKLYPEYATAVSRAYLAQIKRSLAWTDLIITISESSKQDIIDCFDVDASTVWVTPLASRYSVANDSLKLSNTEHEATTYSRYGVNLDEHQPYILFVGTLEPRKNIISIIKAFNALKLSKKVPHKLVLVGRKGWFYEPILNAINQSPYRDDIDHLDYVSDALMVNLYKDATLFVYPSYYEGFGLPVLEAMSLGCPVVTSNTSSIPEVVGDAAIMVAPDDVDELAHALYQVIDSAALRRTMMQAGYDQAATFSWKRTAQSTISAYRALLS